MRTRELIAVAGVVLVCSALVVDPAPAARRRPRISAAIESPPMPPPMPRATSSERPRQQESNLLIGRFCFRCHNDQDRTGGLSLESFDAETAYENAETAEKILRKLRAGMMPPPSAQRPDPATYATLIAALETTIDTAAAENPNPGRRAFQRLNRAEYRRSIDDLLDLDVDVEAWLPADTISHSFDNVADVQSFSPTLMEGYLRAASAISRLALGDINASPSEATYKVPRTTNQYVHVDGAPFGTRGGASFVHNFPADGEYVFKLTLHGDPTGALFGSISSHEEQIEVSINGERLALLDIDPRLTESRPPGLQIDTPPIPIKAGPHRVSAAFVRKSDGPVDDLIAPIEHTLADSQIGVAYGITTLPHLRDLGISGPYNVTGVSDTPSRRKVFTCRPVTAGEEMSCARQIITNLARRAYRRPVDEQDLNGLMSFYETGATEGDFESGIRLAMQAVLASPYFVFRLEREPGGAAPGANYRLADLELASRLSYFLWATVPDEPLMTLAEAGRLGDPGRLESQVVRMLQDPRSQALASRFASLWLRLQDLEKLHPDALNYPQYDHTLADAMRRETEMLFDYLVREDRSFLELLSADYTFVNERLARHYGIPGVAGDEFRKVALTDENRFGLLGHGSMLAATSFANRTSPVNRGKWVLEVFFGTPPPPPPPNVPLLEETGLVGEDRLLTVRERMEIHRANPTCNSCHSMIDPIGLALENFDVTGAWRIKDNGVPVDAASVLFDGTPLASPIDLRNALISHSDAIITNFTEHLMAYAIGRRVEYFDMPAIRTIVREAGQNDNRMSSFIVGVVMSPAFRMSRVEMTDAMER